MLIFCNQSIFLKVELLDCVVTFLKPDAVSGLVAVPAAAVLLEVVVLPLDETFLKLFFLLLPVSGVLSLLVLCWVVFVGLLLFVE
jgi:hypothetical protein